MIKDDYQAANLNMVNSSPGVHLCYFYETKEELLNSVIRYLKAGLDNHEFCMWILSSQLSLSDAIDALAETTPDIAQRVSAGDIEIIPHADWYLKNGDFSIAGTIEGWKTRLSRKITDGYRSIRITGDVTWAIGDDWKDFHEYERAIDLEIRTLNISALCTYPIMSCKPSQVLDVVSSHRFVISERVGKLDVRADVGELGAESEYRRASSNHDSCVGDRALELAHANEELKKEIAKRHRAEQELRKREAQLSEFALQRQTAALQKIFDHLPLMIRLTGVDGQTSLVNRNWEQTLGWTLDELRSHSPGDILDKVVLDPRERERIGNFVKTASGEWRDFKTTLRDGRIIDTSWAVVSLVDGASIWIGQDITERKRADEALREAEEKYRELFENAKDAIYVHDLDGRYTSVNRAAEALSGYSRDDILGKHFAEFVAPEYVEAVRDNLCRKLVTEGETAYEVEVIGKDGRRTPVEVRSRLIRKNNAAIGVQGTARDITERRRAEEALRGYSRRLIDAQEEERQRIARELHDQIGQILTAVQFNLHAVQRSCGTPEATARIDDGIRVLDEALEQVRDLSLDLRPSLLDDLGLFPALRWYAGRLTRRTGLKPEVVTDLPYQDVRFAREVETACFRIAQEALTNVLRHAHASRVKIHLKFIEDRLLLTVTDNGIGFEAKLRAPSSMTLGLQGMQERAVAVGGSFRITSRPSIGTEIIAGFPIVSEF